MSMGAVLWPDDAGPGAPDTYQELVDVLARAATELDTGGAGGIPLEAAQDVAQVLEQVERKLWRFRRSVEAAWFSKHASVVEVVQVVALQEGRRASEVLLDLLDEKALVPNWWRLDKYARDHDVVVLGANDKEGATDGSDS